MKKFKTADGYTLTRIENHFDDYLWTDGDLEFEADPEDGWPVDDDGNRLEGDYIDA